MSLRAYLREIAIHFQQEFKLKQSIMDKEIESEEINFTILKLKTQQLHCGEKAQEFQIKSEIIK